MMQTSGLQKARMPPASCTGEGLSEDPDLRDQGESQQFLFSWTLSALCSHPARAAAEETEFSASEEPLCFSPSCDLRPGLHETKSP